MLALALALSPGPALACGCSPATVQDAWATSSDFLGVRVLDEQINGADTWWLAEVVRPLNGCRAAGERILLHSPTDPLACGASLTVGQVFGVSAHREPEVLRYPTFAFDSCGYVSEVGAVDPADRAWALSQPLTCPAGGAWTPPPGTSWQWQLTGSVDTSLAVDVYDIDLFDVPQAKIDTLHAAGRTVICYFSAGSWEDWRSDAGAFAPSDLGNTLSGWPDERWLDIRSPDVRAIMKTRLDLAASRGCDAVEPDNVDGYQNASGFALSAADQVDYNTFLAREAHDRGLSVGLKNALGLVPQLEPHFDWALNEECLAYSECGDLQPFLDAGKAVFHVEYVDFEWQGPAAAAAVCAAPGRAGFSTLVKTWDLTAWGIACP